MITREEMFELSDQPTFGTYKHLLLLYSIAEGLGAKNILEIGSGYSTLVLNEVVKRNGGHFCTVDRDRKVRRCFASQERMTVLSSTEQIPKKGYDFIFADYFSDAGLEVEYIVSQIEMLYAWLKQDGILAIHDAYDDRFNVEKAIEVMKEKKGFEVLTLPYCYGLCLIRKLVKSKYGKIEDIWKKKKNYNIVAYIQDKEGKRSRLYVLYFDNKYYKWAPLLIESIQLHDPTAKVCCHTVNVRDVSELKKFSNVIGVEQYSIIHNTDISYEFAFQMIERKALFMKGSFEKYPGYLSYILMDVDMLMVGSMEKLYEEFVNYDMAVVMPNPEKCQGGFIISKEVPMVIEFWKEYDEFLMDGEFYYNKDQPSFYRLYRKYKDRLKFLSLGMEYLDPESKDGSYIWSGHRTEHGSKEDRWKSYEKKLKKMKGTLNHE